MIYIFTTVLFLLVAAHFVADYPLQGDAVATGKNKTIDAAKFGVPWWYWMSGHAFTHGICVAFITQNAFLGMCETVFHFIVDHLKCKKLIGIHMDQSLHMTSKIVWATTYILLELINATK